MTRLFAYTCNQPEHILEALEPLRHILVSRAPVSRWGLGYVQSGEVLLTHTPRPSTSDIVWLDRLSDVRSDYVIAHAARDVGLRGTENTQPFRYRRWLYAQDSSTHEPAGSVEDALATLVPDFLRRRVRGKTTAEVVFHVVLAHLHRQNLIDSHDLSPHTLSAVVATSVTAVRDLGLALGNLMMTNGRTLVAASLSGSLYLRRLFLPLFDRQAHGFSGVLMASDPGDDEPGFEKVPGNSVVLAHRDSSIEVLAMKS